MTYADVLMAERVEASAEIRALKELIEDLWTIIEGLTDEEKTANERGEE